MVSMRRVFPLALGLALAAACAQSNVTPTPVQIPLSAPIVSDNFSGTLAVHGSNYHQFSVATPGEVDITLTGTSYAPTKDATTGESVPSTKTDPIPPVQIAVGTPAATTIGLQCSVLTFNTQFMLVSAVPSRTAQLTG